MKRLVLISVVILLCGCSPQRRLARLLERFPPPTASDTIHVDSTIYRDSLVYIYILGDTVEKRVEIDVPVDLPDTVLEAETNWARAEAGLVSNELYLELIQKDTVVVEILDSVIVYHYDTITNTNTTYFRIPTEPHSFKFYRSGFFIFLGLILVGMILLFLFLFRK